MPRVVETTPDPSVVKRAICREGCGCTVEYVPNDVKTLWSGRDISGCSEGEKGFKCPKCKKNIVVERW